MQTSTHEVIKTILRNDPSIETAERSRLLKLIRDGAPQPTPPIQSATPRILRRGQVADLFSVSPRCVDRWGKTGLIQRVTLPGHVRASGYREGDVRQLIEGAQQ